MRNPALFSYLIGMHSPDLAQLKRQQLRLWALYLLLGGLAVLIVLLIQSLPIWQVLERGPFGLVLRLFFGALPAVGLGVSGAISFASHRYHAARQALLLRRAAIEGNRELAPLAVRQPEPLADTEPSRVTSQWGPLEPPPEEKAEQMGVVGFVFPLLGGILLLSPLSPTVI